MKKHNGMRPHDVIVLVKIALKKDNSWMMKDLANELAISSSEISESLTRSVYAGLLSSDKKKIMKSALLEFLEHGLKYVYPQHPGALVRGLPTAYSALPLSNEIESNEIIVWPFADGNIRGHSIEPLHPNVPLACMKDQELYEILASIDALRIGKARERQLAIQVLKIRL
jgi:predicted transcriptional regulator